MIWVPVFSKEHRLDPQINIELLTDAGGLLLMAEAFEGNKAEMHMMLSVIEAFMTTHQLAEVTIVADADMISEGINKRAVEAPGLSFILGRGDRRGAVCGQGVAA